ncbi:prolyl 4-hydroxylase subunit alpha-1-like [Drosophila takahashii]|uniref:prolyl 4-hydroxylase subunit alpha-1-like n=1 Tax=Drosophila takahashii TaxID=29030 RepID=UPI0038991685
MKTQFSFSLWVILTFISLSKSETRPAESIFKFINFMQFNRNLVEYLENYIKALEIKLKVINEALVDLASYHIQFEDDKLGIISSPVGSYSLIHHMQSDWTYWQLFLQEDPGKDELESIISNKRYLPLKEDVLKVCQDISSIISTYDLIPENISKGLGYKSPISSRDCLRMADHSLAMKDFKQSKQWLQLAISILYDPSYKERHFLFRKLNSADLYLKLAEVYVEQKNWLLALETVDLALKSQPQNATLLRLQDYLGSHILLDPPPNPDVDNENNAYRFQGNKSLYCFFQTRKGLFARNRAEMIFLDPLFIIYHD